MEKSLEGIHATPVESEDEYSTSASAQDWSDEEERKIDSVVMPLLMLVFFALQMDRGNIGNALTDYFFRDVGIVQSQFNVGQQLLSVGIVLLEIPSNLILYRVGPRWWISGQVFAWGLVATFQAFQKGLGSFLSTRLLLGMCEAGFIPAGLYTITTWYKSSETSKRFAIFFVGNYLAVAVSGLVAYGILHMRGIAGLAGWQWMFIIEGIFTILVAGVFFALFPHDPSYPIPITGIRYFSDREREIIVRRIHLDDPTKIKKDTKISREELKAALLNWRIYPHLLLTICALAPTSTIWSYAPTQVASFGYPRLKSNALVSVGQWILLCISVFSGIIADHTSRRGPLVIGLLILWWGFALGCRLVVNSHSASLRYALLTLAISFSNPWHAVNGSWLALNAKSAGERSIRMAMFIMSANTSGIVGSQIFQTADAPRYRVGWSVIVALCSAAIVWAGIANLQYWVENRRRDLRGKKERFVL